MSFDTFFKIENPVIHKPKYAMPNCIICDVSTNGGGPAGNISAGWDFQKNGKV